MFKKRFRGFMLLVSCMCVGLISFSLFSSVSQATYFQWKWKTISYQGDVVLRVNGDNLHSSYSGSTFTRGLDLWSNSGANVTIQTAPIPTSNVDIFGVDKSTWNKNGWGNGYAWTQPYKDNGLACMASPVSDYTIHCGTGSEVNYAGIFTNDGNIITSSKRKALIAHELGHVMGLAHTSFITAKSTSLMTAGLAGGLVPSAYDVSEVNSRY
ncbi:hypothetical protein ACFSTH_16970 [Paenibacillus yanchengensis]|uniref:Matrixin family metalloprotease n=1 Tax=Paenibacillus yanchengensis TaxID=2035833 RepID=A0ABW4YQA8_9BACL